jgi:hypothetical protein
MEGGESQTCPIFNSDEIPELIKKYGTKYALWSGVFNIHSGKFFQTMDETFYYSILFDLETGRIIAKKSIYSNKNDNPLRINDYVEDTFDGINDL